MATVQDIFRQIIEVLSGIHDVDEIHRVVEKEIEKAREENPAIGTITSRDFYKFDLDEMDKEYIKSKTTPVPTAEQLWTAVCDWTPMVDTPSSKQAEDTVYRLLISDRFGPVPLGKLRGEFMMFLEPANGCLTCNEIDSENYPSLEYAETSTEAISYPDGHPSEDEFLLKVKSDEDSKLRRFVALGRVKIQIAKRAWIYTGHVLVIDADECRDLHPWFLLASEWPMEDGMMDWDGDDMVHAEKRVRRNDPKVHCVFPGDKNRTPIARLKGYGKGPKPTGQFLKQFGRDFEFDIVRAGGNRRRKQSEWGPDLVEVMAWHWDPEAELEVCYNSAGKEYMRYDYSTKEYIYPDPVATSLRDQVGNIEELVEGPVSLESRMAGTTLNSNRVQHHNQGTLESSTES